VSPTRELGKFLVDLALSDGSLLKADGIEDGRIIPSSAIRKMAKEKFFGE